MYIDPFMRNIIRHHNINYYLDNFENIYLFDLYRFILEIFDHFTLEVCPSWKFGECHPIE